MFFPYFLLLTSHPSLILLSCALYVNVCDVGFACFLLRGSVCFFWGKYFSRKIFLFLSCEVLFLFVAMLTFKTYINPEATSQTLSGLKYFLEGGLIREIFGIAELEGGIFG